MHGGLNGSRFLCTHNLTSLILIKEQRNRSCSLPSVRFFFGRARRRWVKSALAKFSHWCSFPVPQRVFEVAPLVPGSPSLDVKPHSPGETRRRKHGVVSRGVMD